MVLLKFKNKTMTMNRANEILTRYTYQLKDMEDQEAIEKHLKRFFFEAFDLGATIQQESTSLAIEVSRRQEYFKRQDIARSIMRKADYGKPSNIMKLLSYLLHDSWIGGSLGENKSKQLRHEDMRNDFAQSLDKSNLDKRMPNYVG